MSVRLVVALLLAFVTADAVVAAARTGTDANAASAVTAEGRDPAADPGFLGRCLDLIRSGRHDEALALLEPAVGRHPEWPVAQLYIGLIHHEQRHWETAARKFRRVLELDPQLHEARVPYGWSLYYLGEPERAREMFQAYLRIRPDYADAVFALGLIAFDDDDVDGARKRFLRAIELSSAQGDRPREALSRARLSDVLVRAGELERAKEQLERSLALDASSSKARFKLARVLQLLGDEEGAARARQTYERSLESETP